MIMLKYCPDCMRNSLDFTLAVDYRNSCMFCGGVAREPGDLMEYYGQTKLGDLLLVNIDALFSELTRRNRDGTPVGNIERAICIKSRMRDIDVLLAEGTKASQWSAEWHVGEIINMIRRSK